MLESDENVARRWASWGDAINDEFWSKAKVGLSTIPAILSNGGGHIPDDEGPDGLALPGLMTAKMHH